MQMAATGGHVGVARVGPQGLGAQRPHLARRVGPFEGGEVGHRARRGRGRTAWRAFLIERVPRSATRASAPTWSTPGRPCRKRRSADSDAVASTSVGARLDGLHVTRPAYGGPAGPGSRCRGALPDSAPMDVTLVDHPLAAERLTILRDATTENAEFRQALDGLGGMLVYEATRHLPAADVEVTTPLGPAAGKRLADVPMLVPILRAGVGTGGGRAAPDPPGRGRLRGPGPQRGDVPAPAVPGQAARPARRPARRSCSTRCWRRAARSSSRCRLLVDRGAPQPIHVVCVLAAPEGLERIERSGYRRAHHDGGHRQPPERAGLHRPRPGRRRRPPVRPLVAERELP